MGFPILCEVVREERKDMDLLRTALECLTNAFTTPSHGTAAQAQVSKRSDEPVVCPPTFEASGALNLY